MGRPLTSGRRRIDNGLGGAARRRLHIRRRASLWTCRRRAACAGRVRSGPSLGLKLALILRQHGAPSTPRRVARLFVFALGLGRSNAGEDDETERCKGNAPCQSSDCFMDDHRILPDADWRPAPAWVSNIAHSKNTPLNQNLMAPSGLQAQSQIVPGRPPAYPRVRRPQFAPRWGRFFWPAMMRCLTDL